MPVVGVIVGLASEARVLSACTGLGIACSGASPERARTLALDLLGSGCEALASFGLAGGLDPALVSGALCVPEAVLTPAGSRVPVDGEWRMRLLTRLGDARHPAPLLIGRDEPVASPGEKQALFAGTAAAAIDMESHAVAEVASKRAPFLVIRAIADPADRRLPPWLGGVIGANGRPRTQALLAGLTRSPGDLAALIRLAGDARRGLTTLRRVAARAGPLLAFPLQLLHQPFEDELGRALPVERDFRRHRTVRARPAHGYSAYLPLWALARCRNLMEGNAKTTMFGM